MGLTIFDSNSNYFEDRSLFVGSNNIELIIETKLNLTTAETLKLFVTLPFKPEFEEEEGEEIEEPTRQVEWDCILENETQLKYMIQKNDLPYAGIYVLNAYARWEDDTELYGETVLLKVKNIGE